MGLSPTHLQVIDGGGESSSGPLGHARRFRQTFLEHGANGLHCMRGEFHRWNGAWYEVVENAEIRSRLYAHLEDEGTSPNRRSVSDVADALAGIAYIPPDDPPFALPGYSGPAASELVICRNGAFHVASRRLHASDPRLFCTSALPLEYDEDAPEPVEWLAFLRALWPDDPASIEALQEFTGLAALTDDTSLQKMLVLIGPPRGGKGVIFRMVGALAGAANICAPTLSSLGARFGLQSLIGRRLALISDARIGRTVDAAAVVESLLRITGEDRLSVEQKFAPDWQGRLPVRFMLASNELPSLADASSALSSRLIILRLSNSFLGREDHGLESRLLAELPGVLRWALDGLERLRERGHLVQPESGNDLVGALKAMNSPIGEFIEDCLMVYPDAWEEKAKVFQAWRDWCSEHGRSHAGNDATFAKQLRASLPHISEAKPRASDGSRLRVFQGIRLRRFGDPNQDDAGPAGPGGPGSCPF